MNYPTRWSRRQKKRSMNEAELLLTSILDCSRLDLYRNKKIVLHKEQSAFLSNTLKQRINGRPLQYILGKADFFGFEFKVSPDVLIPRPETEILVEKAAEIVRSKELGAGGINIMDIGTGSGCIAITLAKLLPQAVITATDISEKALEIARENARLHNVSDRITFSQSDLFPNSQLPTPNSQLIISNPPYVASEEIDHLQLEVKHEPRLALDAGIDGLDFYRRIIPQAGAYLKSGGYLLMEIGFGQRKKIEKIFHNSPNFEIIEVIKDYSDIDRIMVAKNG